MRYTVATIAYHFHDEWQQDVFEQALADIGFETFFPIEGTCNTNAYIQTKLFSQEQLLSLMKQFSDVQLIACEECPDENWNKTWEEEHPEFIIDTPNGQISIHPHCAFGAGYHETTGMFIEQLLKRTEPIGRVLDNGCGTGILGIVAAKLGASQITMVDIDEKSVNNAIENSNFNGLVCNQPTASCSIVLGDTPPIGKYDLIFCNIHKNILLQQMPIYANLTKKDSEVWVSGFVKADSQDISTKAIQNGFLVKSSFTKGEWVMLQLIRR